MAGDNIGSYDFELNLKSNAEDQLKKIRREANALDREIKGMKAGMKALGGESQALQKNDIADKTKKLKELQTALKGTDTRLNQILASAHKISELKSSITSMKLGGALSPEELRKASQMIQSLARSLRELMSVSDKSKGSFFTGEGFKTDLGALNRGIADAKRSIGSIQTSFASEVRKRENAAQKEIDNFAKAEDQAAKYYRTRKTNVENAILSLSEKQAQLRHLMDNASREDAAAMKAAAAQAEILIKRLAAAKEQYEKMQVLKAQGVPGAALSRTYLGKYTGISELFGGNFSKMDKTGIAASLSNFAGGGTLSYSGFNHMYREIVALAKSHSAIQEQYNKREGKEAAEKERIYQQTLEKTRRDQERNQREAERTAEAQSKAAERSARAEINAVNATEERIARLRSMLSEGLSTRRDSRNLEINVDELTEKLRRLAQVILALRADKQGFGYATNLFDKGADKVEISSIQEKILAQRELNAEKERQQRIDERNNNTLIANRDKRGSIQNNINSILGKWANISPNVQNSYISGIIKDFRNLSKALSGLSDKDMMDGKAVTNLLRRRHYGTMAKEIGIFFRRYRQEAMAAAAEAKTASEAEEKLKTQINRLRALSERWQGRMDASNSSKAMGIATHQRGVLNSQALALEGIKRSNFLSDADYIKAVNDALIQSKHLQESAAIAAAQYNNENKQAAEAARQTAENQKKVAAAARESTEAARSLASAFSKVHDRSSSVSRVLQEMKSVFFQGGAVYTAQSLVNSIIQQGGMIEQQHIALRAMIGDAQVADQLFGQIKRLAIDSPFTFSEMIRDTKMMTAYGIATKDVYDTTKRLADISAGLGVSVERLALAFGQTQARGWLDAKELRQFAYAGLPLLNKLSQYYTGKEGKEVSTADVTKRIKKRQVGFEDVRDILWQMTDEGGQFFDMQDKLTDTLLGKYNKLKDAWDIMMSNFTTGGNAVGETFKGVLDIIAELIQNIDKITPILISMGAAFGGKALIGTIQGKFGAGKILADMNKAVVLANNEFAVREMSRVAEGQITMSVARQNIERHKSLLASSELRNMTYSQLLAEGKMSMFQLGRLAKAGQISLSLVEQLSLTGQLTRYQALLVLQASRYAGTWRGTLAQMRLGLTGLWASVKNLFSWGNLLTFGIGAVAAIAMSYKQKAGEITDAVQANADKYKKKAADIDDTIRKTNGTISKGTVSAMKSALEKAGQLTEEVQNQVNHASTLAEKYEILRQKMEDVLRVSKEVGESRAVSEAIRVSGGEGITAPDTNGFMRGLINAANWFTPVSQFFGMSPQYITDNVAKINEFESNISRLKESLRDNFNEIDKAFKTVTNNAHDSVFYKKVSKLPFEQRIEAILSSRYSDEFIAELKKTDKGAAKLVERLIDYSKSLGKRLGEVTQENVPSIVKYIQNWMGLLGVSTNKWSNTQVQTFVLMFDHIMQAAGKMSDYVRGKVYMAFLQSSGLGKSLNPSGLRVVTRIKNGKKVKDTYIGSEGDDKKGHYVVVGFERRNGHVYDKKMYDPSADKPEPPSITGIDRDDSTSKSGGSKADKAHSMAQRADNQTLKALEARLRLINDAYSVYKKYYNVLHDETASIAVVRNAFKGKGLSNEDVAKITSEKGFEDLLEAFAERVRNTKFRLPKEIQDRKDELIASAIQKKKDTQFDVLSESQADTASSAEFDTSRMNRVYNAYKTLYAATGDAMLSASVSGLSRDANSSDFSIYKKGAASTGFAQIYSRYLKNYLDSIILQSPHPEKAIDYNAVYGMSDKEIEKYAGSLFASDDPAKVSMFAAQLKKVRDLVTDTEYQEGMNTFAELMKSIVTTAANVNRENGDYTAKMQQLGERREMGDLSKSEYEQAVEILNVQHETKLLQASDEYKQFMDNVISMTRSAAEKIRSKVVSNLQKQLWEGVISAKQYADAIKQVDQQMDALNTNKGGLASFMSGGLRGLFQHYKNKGYSEEQEAAQKYQESTSWFKKWFMSGSGKDLSEAQEAGSEASKLSRKGKKDKKKGEKGEHLIESVSSVFNTINSSVQSYKKFEENWTKTFGDGLKDSKFSSFMSGFAESSQGLSDAWNSALSGDVAGVLEGTFRSFTGWFTFGNAAANKRYQNQVEYYKKFLNVMNDISSSLSARVSSAYGSSSIATAKKLKETYSAEASEARETYQRWSQAHTIHQNHRNRMYLFGTKGDSRKYMDMVNAYLQSAGYDGYVTGDTIQNLSGDWLKKIKEDIPEAWAHLNEEAAGYLDNIIKSEEATGDLKSATDKLSETLTGMTFDGVQQSYESLLDNLSSDNDDFANDLEKKMRTAILNSMIANLYKGELQKDIDYVTSLGTNDTYLDKNGNVKKHYKRDAKGNLTYDEDDIASEYTAEEYQEGKARVGATTGKMVVTRNMLADTYGWSDSGSSSMTSSIKGVTEQTPDLLASYLNAIRADVSVIRQTNGIYLPKIDITTQAQLQQLNQIASNTALNAEIARRMETAVSNMNSILEGVKNGTRTLSVKVQ